MCPTQLTLGIHQQLTRHDIKELLSASRSLYEQLISTTSSMMERAKSAKDYVVTQDATPEKKQYFNVVGSTKTCIDRNDEGSIRCLTCVCVPADEFSQEVFDVLQDGQKMTSDLQDDEVEGTYDSDVYYRIQYLQLHACSPSLGVSPDHATVEESGINRENI